MTSIVTIESDPERFRAQVSSFLERDSVRHTAPITVLHGVIDGLYAEWMLAAVESPAGEVTACAVQTLPHNVLLAAETVDAARALADGLRGHDLDLPGVVGNAPEVHGFAAAWCEGLPRTAIERRAQRLFRLDVLIPPRAAAGSARLASDDELDLVVDWFEAFRLETAMPAFSDVRRGVADRIADGRLWVWVTGGEIVSFLGRSPVLAGQARIGPVYTPPERRGAGFASNLVADATRQLLDLGAIPTLYTDLANPTSNAIYQAIGYRAVADSFEIVFAPAVTRREA